MSPVSAKSRKVEILDLCLLPAESLPALVLGLQFPILPLRISPNSWKGSALSQMSSWPTMPMSSCSSCVTFLPSSLPSKGILGPPEICMQSRVTDPPGLFTEYPNLINSLSKHVSHTVPPVPPAQAPGDLCW